MQHAPAPTPEGLRARSIARVVAGEPVAAVAAELGVHPVTLRRWASAAGETIPPRRAPAGRPARPARPAPAPVAEPGPVTVLLDDGTTIEGPAAGVAVVLAALRGGAS